MTAIGCFLIVVCVMAMICTTVREFFAWVVISALVFGMVFAARAQDIPHAAQQYRRDLTRNAHLVWGLDAPVASFAAQIHQESGWRRDARSPYAFGLAQFTPDTAAWIGRIDSELATGEPGNPVWALRALVRYDRWLWDRSTPAAACDRMAFALAGYNGGAGWIDRDRRKARAAGADPDRWWDAVERYNAGRNNAAFTENRDYPRRILLRYEPLYLRAGWGIGMCPHARNGGSLPPGGASLALGRPGGKAGSCS